MIPFLLLIAASFVSIIQCETCTRHGVSCPVYEVLEKHEDYEDRMYPSLVWVSTSAVGVTRNKVSRTLIKRLYSYLGGANDRGEHVDMMVPVRTVKAIGDELNNYTMSIALAPEHQEDPPIPTNPLVFMERELATRYVTRSFSGMARAESLWDHNAEMLRASVAHDNGVNTSFYFWCVYDSPWREENRLNEVWMLKKNDDDA